MNKQDQRKADAHRNQTTVSEFVKLETSDMLQEFSGRTHCEKPNQQIQPKDNQELFCACNGLKCAGICRESHLHRERMANPKAAAKGAKSLHSWTNPPNRCPEVYEN